MAFRHATSGRSGPVYLEFPISIMSGTVEESEVAIPQDYRPTGRPQGDPALITKAIDLLLGAEKPVVLAGNGVWWSQASQELRDFIGLTKNPVRFMHDMTRGSVPTDHLLFDSGSAPNADVVLVVGQQMDPGRHRARQNWARPQH